MRSRIMIAVGLDRVSPRVRGVLDHDKLWLGVFFVGMLLAFGLSYNAATTSHQASVTAIRSAAARDAAITASANSRYNSCIASRPVLANFSTHVAGVNDFVDAVVANSAASMASIPPTDHEYATRRNNLLRLLRAEVKVQAVRSIAVPTVQQCEALRTAILGASPPRTGRVR